MAAPDPPDDLTRPAKTAGYAPHVYTGSYFSGIIDGRPRFTWIEVERMRLDPQIQFGLRILRAPLYGVTWAVTSPRPDVKEWVEKELLRVYRRVVPRLVRSYEYGVAAGEVTFKKSRKGRVRFADFAEVHPKDARPLVWERGPRAGRMAALRVSGAPAGDVILNRKHGFWFKGEAEFGAWYGRPRLAGAYEPWLEKRGRHGAIDARRLFYKKGAFRGPSMRYPPGRTDFGDPGAPHLVSNQDIARELVEKFENGGVLALPNVKGPTGDYLWTWEDPKSFSDVAGLLDYPKQLDREILIGLGIPPELVEASTVGSGYSGRAIPAQVFFTSMDEFAGLLTEAIVEQILRPLVLLNFGKAGFSVQVNSLAKLVASAPPGGGPIPQAGPAGPGPVPYQGPRGGTGTVDPATGKVHYGQGRPHVRLSLEARKEQKKQKKAARRRCRLSWTPYQGPRGGRGWVHDQTGEVRYQADQPRDESAAGPESVYAAPQYAHLPQPENPQQIDAVRAQWAERAKAAGIDPGELHRGAAARLDANLASHAEWGTLGSPDQMATRAERLAATHATAEQVAEAKKLRDMAHAHYEGAKAGPGVDHDAWRGKLAAHDARVAEQETSHGHRRRLEQEAAEWRSGARRVATPDHPRLLADAYHLAHHDILAEREAKEDAAAFADGYFERDDPADRARGYLEAVAGGLDVDHLPADTRQAVAEDLVTLPPADLAPAVADAVDQYGLDSSTARPLTAAAEAAPPAAPVKADWAKPGDYYVVTDDGPNEEQWTGLQLAARVAGAVRARGKGVLVVPAAGPVGKVLDGDHYSHSGHYGLDDDNGRQVLFDRLAAAPMLAQADVPASARDYGTTSGALAPDKVTDDAWNPNTVDAYKPIDETGEWYLVRRSEGSAAADETGDTYAFVARKDVPPLSRLPAAYWEGLDTSPGVRAEHVERAQIREEKQAPQGAEAKKGIQELKKGIKGHRARIGLLKQEWHKAHKGVPEADRLDEPDWDAVDRSPLQNSHDSRQDHLDALDDLHTEYRNHVAGLEKDVAAAREHGDVHRKAAAGRKEKVDALKARWAALMAHNGEGSEYDAPEEPDWDDDDAETAVEEAEASHGPEHHAAAAAERANGEKVRARYQALADRDAAATAAHESPDGHADLEDIDYDAFNALHRSVTPADHMSEEYNRHAEMYGAVLARAGESNAPDPSEHDAYGSEPELDPTEMDAHETADPTAYAGPREHAAALADYHAGLGPYLNVAEKELAAKERAAAHPEYYAAAATWAEAQADWYDHAARHAALAAAQAEAEGEDRDAEDAAVETARAAAEKLRAWAKKYRPTGPARLSLTAAARLWAAATGPVYATE